MGAQALDETLNLEADERVVDAVPRKDSSEAAGYNLRDPLGQNRRRRLFKGITIASTHADLAVLQEPLLSCACLAV